jgi:hypothetical protein
MQYRVFILTMPNVNSYGWMVDEIEEHGRILTVKEHREGKIQQ